MPTEFLRRANAWQSKDSVKEWLRQSVSDDAMRAISFNYRSARSKSDRSKSRAGENISGVEVTLPLPLAVAIK
eukprot:12733350-Heterocapsa_arctica.AAC.1